jgi:putative PIN family toxin of toxin-antitoxin system
VLKAVVDANVFISALLNPGSAADLIAELAHDKFQLFYPARLIIELKRINDKPKLSTTISPEAVAELLDLISEKGSKMDPRQPPEVKNKSRSSFASMRDILGVMKYNPEHEDLAT